jgi:hypothetical protein
MEPTARALLKLEEGGWAEALNSMGSELPAVLPWRTGEALRPLASLMHIRRDEEYIGVAPHPSRVKFLGSTQPGGDR